MLGKTLRKNLFESVLSPFGLVIVLTIFSFFLVFSKGIGEGLPWSESLHQMLSFWQNGFFGLLGFTLQMMMILVFGYSLAIFKPINRLLRWVSNWPDSLLKSVLLTAGITMCSGLLNWGFGLIVGAVLARFMHEGLVAKNIRSNPALLAASGYLGMGVWHGGLSGSAPLSMAESGNFLEEIVGVVPAELTLFSNFNLITTGGLCCVFLATAWFLAFKSSKNHDSTDSIPIDPIPSGNENSLARFAGLFMIVVLLAGLSLTNEKGLGFITLNWVNFLLFSLTLFVYRSSGNFSLAVSKGLKSSADIFIQFPFYAGILGLITDSGILVTASNFVVEFSSLEWFPILSFLSAALVNLFVPSGGGQWAIQGPLILETASVFGLELEKMIMVFAYGDQISNLLQPFWALPLLAITGVSVRKIFPYTLVFFLAGLIWLCLSIVFFF
ncbi:TIGR00366 family protein [Algoriphagus litoralis]|uniref:TIGR00366 family protein n=1 Tax=Algoriphagus litoralis TaxID=2202829 RepID=UPI000DB9E176|nr:TIGR00366 family protein [Algoriphagus litoralis]